MSSNIVDWLRQHADDLEVAIQRCSDRSLSEYVCKTLNNIERLRQAADEIEQLRGNR